MRVYLLSCTKDNTHTLTCVFSLCRENFLHKARQRETTVGGGGNANFHRQQGFLSTSWDTLCQKEIGINKKTLADNIKLM